MSLLHVATSSLCQFLRSMRQKAVTAVADAGTCNLGSMHASTDCISISMSIYVSEMFPSQDIFAECVLMYIEINICIYLEPRSKSGKNQGREPLHHLFCVGCCLTMCCVKQRLNKHGYVKIDSPVSQCLSINHSCQGLRQQRADQTKKKNMYVYIYIIYIHMYIYYILYICGYRYT